MTEIEDAIERVENLYRAVTGKELPAAAAESPYAPIPAERDPVQHVQDQMDRLYAMLGTQPAQAAPAWTPAIAIWEGDAEVIVYADVPGVPRDHIEVAVVGGAITLAGSRPPPVGNGHKLRFGERRIGQFRRLIPLGPGLKLGELTARLRDGVLEIVIPRDAAAGGANRRPVPIS